MNMLQEFEGLTGEVLACAALRLIMLDNPRVRESIIDVLSAASLLGPISSESHFACYRELSTVNETDESGRLDLVMELDDAVIGIEAKFNAAFQPNQPNKYKKTLALRAELLTKLKGAIVEPQLFLVAPEVRRREVEHVEPATAFVSWEEIVEAVERNSQALSDLERDFVWFVRNKMQFLPRLVRDLPHLTRNFPERGSESQCNFLRAIYREAFNLSGGKLSRGPYWCGYYIAPGNQVWLGFRPSRSPNDQKAELIMASLRDFDLPEPPFQRFDPDEPITLVINNRFRKAQKHWLVMISPKWSDPEYLREIFHPVLYMEKPITKDMKVDDFQTGR